MCDIIKIGGIKMKINSKKILIILTIIIIFVSLAVIGLNLLTRESKGKYIIITDSRYNTLQNDGGSHSDIYYEIDLNKNEVKKFEDLYIGFKGYEYQGKLIYNKSINSSIAMNLGDLLDNLISKEDINDTNNYSPFVIKQGDIEKDIYSQNSIELLKEQLQQIDNY